MIPDTLENEWDYEQYASVCECGHKPTLYHKHDSFRLVCNSCGSASIKSFEARDVCLDWNENNSK